MDKKICKLTGILLLGAFGGFLFQALVLPRLVSVPLFEDFKFVRNITERETIINPVEKIIIRENKALKDAIEKVEKTIVGIETSTTKGSGMIVTSDGLIVTLSRMVPVNSDFKVFINGEETTGEIIKRDVNKNLLLIKIKKKGLFSSGFADLENLKLGKRVFLLGGLGKITNEGIVRYFDEEIIETNILEEKKLDGSPLFNIEGRLLGLNQVYENGKVVAIPVKKIKEFTGF